MAIHNSRVVQLDRQTKQRGQHWRLSAASEADKVGQLIGALHRVRANTLHEWFLLRPLLEVCYEFCGQLEYPVAIASECPSLRRVGDSACRFRALAW